MKVLRFCIYFVLGLVAAVSAQSSDLARRLSSKDSATHNAAYSEMQALPKDSQKQLVPDLVQILKSGDREGRGWSAYALGDIGAQAQDAVPALIEALKDADTWVQGSAAASLGKIGSGAKDAVPALMGLLGNPNHSVASGAAQALGGIGPDASPAVPALVWQLKSADKFMRFAAAYGLGGIGGLAAKSALPTLIAMLRDEYPQARFAAASALGAIGPDAKDAVPVLAESLGDPDSDVAKRAASSLGDIGPDAKGAVFALLEAMKNGKLSRSAQYALDKIDPGALKGSAAVAPLLINLKDKDHYVRSNAAELLGDIVPPPLEAIPALIEALKDEDHYVRDDSAHSLGNFGIAAKDAVPALTAMLKDPDPQIRQRVLTALSRISPDSKQARDAAEAAERSLLPVKVREHLWRDFGVGTNVTYKMNTSGMEMEMTTVLLKKSDTGYVLRTDMVVSGNKVDGKPIEYIVEKPTGGDKSAPNALKTKITVGDEEIEVPAGRFKCHWTRHETEKSMYKIWSAKEVPGRIVKMESEFSGTKTTEILVKFEKK